MKNAHKVAPYSLRIDEQLKARAREAAVVHRRSLNAELEQLIEEGFKWREIQTSRP
mgnify:CR=1 FL=1